MEAESREDSQYKKPSLSRKHGKSIFLRYVILILLAGGMIAYSFFLRWQKDREYSHAIALYNAGSYKEAKEEFDKFGNYEDSFFYLSESLRNIKYNDGQEFLAKKEYLKAVEIFRLLGEFKDSEDKVYEALYGQGKYLYDKGEYEEAFTFFQDSNSYSDSDLYIANITLLLQKKMQKRIYEEAYKLFESKEFTSALEELSKIEDYPNSADLIQKCNDAIAQRNLATTISAGIQYSLGVASDGTVLTTGYNSDGQSNVTDWNNIVSISGFGVLTIGLKEDGKVVTAGIADGNPVDTSQWENIIAVSAGERYVIGLKNDGTVEGAGHKADRQLQVSNWTDIVAIATGWRHTVGLDKDGRIHITGYGDKRQLDEIRQKKDDWDGVVAIAAGGGSNGIGGGHTVGLKDDGTVVAVGDKKYQQCDVDDWTDIVAIAAGSGYTLGLKEDGSVVYAGYNDSNKGENTKKWNNILSYDET